MKRRFVFYFLLSLLLVGGCQEASQNRSMQDKADNANETAIGVVVEIENGGKFPEFLVGRWKAIDAGWEFTFEPDGNIVSAVIDNGMLRVNPADEVVEIPLVNGGKGTYNIGQWLVRYSYIKLELEVTVVVDEYHLDMKTFGMMGSSVDLFVGSFSEDLRYWETTWTSMPRIIALLPEPSEFPIDPNELINKLVFEKQP